MPGPQGGACRICKLDAETRNLLRAGRVAGEGPTAQARSLPGITTRNLEYHWERCDEVPLGSAAAELGKIAALLERSGIAVDEIARVREVSLKEYQGMYKDNEGEAHVVDMAGAGIKLTPKWADGPAWPVVQPAKPRVVRNVKAKPARLTTGLGWKRAVILPDPQIGFRRLEDGTLDPFHDERAMDLGIQIIEATDPDLIINLGDFLDLSEASRFLKEPAFAMTTNASLEVGAEFLARQRAASSQATRIIYIEGNHDFRLKRAIIENAAWAYNLRPGNQPDAWPVLSVPNLLSFEHFGVEYVEGYPAGIFYINENLAAVHGERVRSGGSTAAAIIDDERVSLMTGHVHRIEQHFKTVRTAKGPRTRSASSIGCMCRTDGAVPSTKTGPRHDGRTPDRQENWQQALAVVHYEEGDGRFDVDIRPIFDGSVVWGGKLFESRVTPDWTLRRSA